ncbi:MAG: type II toxin-antitoxin system RelE/ParE family toxin [Synergistaceae bacterium]|nr:type II toxin-antitoxin system RelE/ParE family toxin [Synergistaceae bacterium]
MSWEVITPPVVQKRIDRIPQSERGRILAAIGKLEDGLVGDIRPMKGSNKWRLRVGGWRIVMSVNWRERVINIVLVDTRGDVYKH